MRDYAAARAELLQANEELQAVARVESRAITERLRMLTERMEAAPVGRAA